MGKDGKNFKLWNNKTNNNKDYKPKPDTGNLNSNTCDFKAGG